MQDSAPPRRPRRLRRVLGVFLGTSALMVTSAWRRTFTGCTPRVLICVDRLSASARTESSLKLYSRFCLGIGLPVASM